MLRAEKLKMIQHEQGTGSLNDQAIEESTLALKLRERDLPKYAACIKLSAAVEKKLRANKLNAFRSFLRATLVPANAEIDHWFQVEKSQQPGSLSSLFDVLTDLATQEASPRPLPQQSANTSISSFTDSVLSTVFSNLSAKNQATAQEKRAMQSDDRHGDIYKKMDTILLQKLSTKSKLPYGKPMT